MDPILFRAVPDPTLMETKGNAPHQRVRVFVGPEGNGALAGDLRLRLEEAEALRGILASHEEILATLRAVQRHLMVRPENRLREADENVRLLVRTALVAAGGAGPG